MEHALKSDEWRRIWVLKTFQIEIEKGGGRNNSAILQKMFSPRN